MEEVEIFVSEPAEFQISGGMVHVVVSSGGRQVRLGLLIDEFRASLALATHALWRHDTPPENVVRMRRGKR